LFSYRLAPEHPYPAGLEDCYTVAKYLLEYKQSQELSIDPTKIIIAGDSAGKRIFSLSKKHSIFKLNFRW